MKAIRLSVGSLASRWAEITDKQKSCQGIVGIISK
jgi:hypothetical protein